MRTHPLIVLLIAAIFLALTFGYARADLLIKIDKSAQRMAVSVNGKQLYYWPVSTGASRYDTPSGTFRPFRMDIDHHSDEWDDAPMPYSIFFSKTGNAVHGTYEQRHLGTAVSHGCVRLSVKNAATLWNLVKQEKMANTTVVVTGAIRDDGPMAVARSQPLSLTPDNPTFDASQRSFQPRYDDRPSLPFPFFIFGR